jgi:glycosyltransferase involved in cell wall biosynthesis
VTRDRRVLAFPFHDWRKAEVEGFRTRDAHLLEAIARRDDVGRVLVVDRPTSAAERILRGVAARAAGEPMSRWREGRAAATVTAVRDSIEALDIELPDWIAPVRRRRGWWFDVFGRPDVARVIDRSVAERLEVLTDVIAWVPTVAPVMFRNGGRTVFDSLDNWVIHPVLSRHAGEAMSAYAAILPLVDAAFVSGPASRDVLARWRAGIEVLPNGVDPDAFARAGPRPPDLPRGPVVGYAGKLAERIDDDLVVAVAAALPDVTFAFLGPVLERRAVRAMRACPNVQLLGDVPYPRLPDYLRAFDVGWIPHRVGQGETGGDPIKLYEYWAAGLQVVSTRIDGMDRWSAQVRLVDDAVAAVAAIRGILDGSLERQSTGIPPGRTWDEIAGVLLGDAESPVPSAPAPPPGSSAAGS